jgi:hypothetical protein
MLPPPIIPDDSQEQYADDNTDTANDEEWPLHFCPINPETNSQETIIKTSIREYKKGDAEYG